MNTENGSSYKPDLKTRIFDGVVSDSNRVSISDLLDHEWVKTLSSNVGDVSKHLSDFSETLRLNTEGPDELPFTISPLGLNDIKAVIDAKSSKHLWDDVSDHFDLQILTDLNLSIGEPLSVGKIIYSSDSGWDSSGEAQINGETIANLNFGKNFREKRNIPCRDTSKVIQFLSVVKMWEAERNYFWPLVEVVLASSRNEGLTFTQVDVDLIKNNLPKISPSPITLAKSLYSELEDAKDKLGNKKKKVIVSRNESGLVFKFVDKGDIRHEFAVFSIGGSGDYYNSIFPGLSVETFTKTDELPQATGLTEAVTY